MPDVIPPSNVPSASLKPAGGLVVVFAPILLLIAVTAALAGVAWWIGWYRAEMVIAAEATGAVAIVVTMVLLYRQTRQREATTRALQNVRARASDVVESAMDAIITVDDDHRVVMFNAAAQAVFGWPRDAVIGRPLDLLLPERFRDLHRRHVAHFGLTGATARRMGAKNVLIGMRADGQEFPIEASISQHREEGRQLFTVILRDVTERVRVEAALRRSKDELRELGAAAHAAREEEKTRIARELHDELAQSLTALQMDVAWCKQRVAENPSATAAKLAQMAGVLDTTVAATRRIAADLRPLMLDDLGLVPAVEWLAETFTQRNGVPCDLAVEDWEIELPQAQATAVFRIVQESLANVAKHARAERVQVAIGREGTDLTLCIRDNGVGFSPEDPRKPDSYGLLGLRERASLLGGAASITSAPGEGTWIEVRLPLSQEALAS